MKELKVKDISSNIIPFSCAYFNASCFGISFAISCTIPIIFAFSTSSPYICASSTALFATPHECLD